MQGFCFRIIVSITLCFSAISVLEAHTARYRVMWRDNPSTSMVIGWDQISGSAPVVYFDRVDRGRKVSAYPNSKKPSYVVQDKNMKNHFVRLNGLKPNTTYYFVIKDSEGVSQRMSFKTAPGNSDERISIIAGGDSRNHRRARLDANSLVSKLRPHAIMFSGDMTDNDTGEEWVEWFDDWQKTIGSDGRIFPIIVTRGNHEASNQSLVNLFDVKSPDLYYALNLGGDLLRVYTLNTLIPAGGAQKAWLQSDLSANGDKVWRFAQYHQAMRPHTESKPEKNELILNWATLFHKYRVNVAVESDAHVVKWTYPIRPSREAGSAEGFIRDDEKGTVFIGEGCWGAPLRDNNDKKPWTRASASFNQFKWIFVDKYKVEIRTVKTDGSYQVDEVNHSNIFEPPYGLVLWQPRNGDVIRIKNKALQEAEDDYSPNEADFEEPILADKQNMQIQNFSVIRRGANMAISWDTQSEPPAIKYEIQRSTDGGNLFRTIAQVRSKGTGSNSYSCRDENLSPSIPTKQISYRLKYQRPSGQLSFYNPPPKNIEESGEITNQSPPKPSPSSPKPNSGGSGPDWSKFPKLIPDPATGRIKIKYVVRSRSDVVVSLINRDFKELSRLNFKGQLPDSYLKSLDVNKVPSGNYLIVIKANGKVINRYRVIK